MPTIQAVYSSLEQGGPNWQREWRDYISEEESSWQPAQRFSKRQPPLTGANAIPVPPSPKHFDRPRFPVHWKPDARPSVFKRIEIPRNHEQLRPDDIRTSVFERIEFPLNPEQLRSELFFSSSSILGKPPVHPRSDKGGQSLNLKFMEKSRDMSKYPSSSTFPGICSHSVQCA